jgi:hypothetical protein
MLKKSVTYTDFNGQEVTEVFRFHLSKAELIEMEVEHDGGLAAFLQKIIDTNDGKQIISSFKDLILKSYGTISTDGKRFVKDEHLTKNFQQTEAYSNLFMELATNAEAAAEFVNGIMPQGLEEDIKKLAPQTPNAPVAAVAEVAPQFVITKAQAEEMSKEDLINSLNEGFVLEK